MKAITIIRHDDGAVSVVGLEGGDDDIALIHEGLDAVARGRRPSISLAEEIRRKMGNE